MEPEVGHGAPEVYTQVLEAVRLVRGGGVAVKQAAHDLGVHENVLRKRVKNFAVDPAQASPRLMSDEA